MRIERADHTAEFEQQDIAANKGISCIAYLGILFLVPLLAAPNSKFAKFHANQGLLLFIVLAAAGIVFGIIQFLLGLLFFWLPTLASIIVGLLWLAYSIASFAVIILSLIDAVNGKAKELPIIGKHRLIT